MQTQSRNQRLPPHIAGYWLCLCYTIAAFCSWVIQWFQPPEQPHEAVKLFLLKDAITLEFVTSSFFPLEVQDIPAKDMRDLGCCSFGSPFHSGILCHGKLVQPQHESYFHGLQELVVKFMLFTIFLSLRLPLFLLLWQISATSLLLFLVPWMREETCRSSWLWVCWSFSTWQLVSSHQKKQQKALGKAT